MSKKIYNDQIPLRGLFLFHATTNSQSFANLQSSAELYSHYSALLAPRNSNPSSTCPYPVRSVLSWFAIIVTHYLPPQQLLR